MTQNISIRNCSYGYACDQHWYGLNETTDSSIRFCSTCQKEVHWCNAETELAGNIVLNRAVAIDTDSLVQKKEVYQSLPVSNKPSPAGNFDDFDEDIPF